MCPSVLSLSLPLSLSLREMHPHKQHHDRHAGTAENKDYLHKIARQRIDPPAVAAGVSAADLLDAAFLSYNAGRLREGCQLFARKMLAADGTVGLALSGALDRKSV